MNGKPRKQIHFVVSSLRVILDVILVDDLISNRNNYQENISIE